MFNCDFIKQKLFFVNEDLRFPHFGFLLGRELMLPLTKVFVHLGTGKAWSNFSFSQCFNFLFLILKTLSNFLALFFPGQVAPFEQCFLRDFYQLPSMSHSSSLPNYVLPLRMTSKLISRKTFLFNMK